MPGGSVGMTDKPPISVIPRVHADRIFLDSQGSLPADTRARLIVGFSTPAGLTHVDTGKVVRLGRPTEVSFVGIGIWTPKSGMREGVGTASFLLNSGSRDALVAAQKAALSENDARAVADSIRDLGALDRDLAQDFVEGWDSVSGRAISSVARVRLVTGTSSEKDEA